MSGRLQHFQGGKFRVIARTGWAALLCCLAPAVWGAEVSITIEGLSDELTQAVRAGLSLQQYVDRDVTAAQVRRLFATAPNEAHAALEPYGYYNATATGELRTTDKGFEAVLRVAAGDPVLVRSSSVRVDGEGAQQGAVERALGDFKPTEGEVLDHGVYESSKQAVESALLSRGFMRLQLLTHRVEVTRAANTADIDVLWDSGPRMKLGEVSFSDAQFPQQFLERYIPWQRGDYYSPDELLRLQQRLTDADYFAAVIVQPDVEQADDDLEIPVNVTLTPAKRTVYTAGAYVSTDSGPGVRAGMQRRWMNRRGHKFQADADVAQRRTALSLGYRIPLPGPDDRSFNFGYAHRDEQTTTSNSRNDRIAFNETRQWHGFTRTLGGVYLSGNFKVGSEAHYSNLLYAEGTLMRKQGAESFTPRRGWSAGLTVRAGSQGLLSDTDFTQVQLDGKYITTIAPRQRVLLRGTLGAMAVGDFNQLTPELRFFAGGDRSIRGFGYQELGSTNAQGDVIGGTYLAVGSVEYERFFSEKWGGAVFADGGDAFRSSGFSMNVGAGVGVRWRSPVGMVRLDVAKPVVSNLSDSLQFHISIGPDL